MRFLQESRGKVTMTLLLALLFCVCFFVLDFDTKVEEAKRKMEECMKVASLCTAVQPERHLWLVSN